jgi:hypothetical protein
MGRDAVNLARSRTPDVSKLTQISIPHNAEHNLDERVAHYEETSSGKFIPHVNIFRNSTEAVVVNTSPQRALVLVGNGVWVAGNTHEGQGKRDTQRNYVKAYCETLCIDLFPNSQSIAPTPAVYDAHLLSKSEHSFNIMNELKDGKFHSIIVLNAEEKDFSTLEIESFSISDGVLIKDLLREHENVEGVQPLILAVIDPSCTKIPIEDLKRKCRRFHERYPCVNLLFPLAEYDETLFAYEFGAVTQFIRNITKGSDERSSLSEAQEKVQERTESMSVFASPIIPAIRNTTFLYFPNVTIETDFSHLSPESLHDKIFPQLDCFPNINDLLKESPGGLLKDDCAKISNIGRAFLYRSLNFYNIISSYEQFKHNTELFCIAIAVAQGLNHYTTELSEDIVRKLHTMFSSSSDEVPFPENLLKIVKRNHSLPSEAKILAQFSNVMADEETGQVLADLACTYMRMLKPDCRPDKPFQDLKRWYTPLSSSKTRIEARENVPPIIDGPEPFLALVLDRKTAKAFHELVHQFHKAHTKDTHGLDLGGVNLQLFFDKDNPYCMLPSSINKNLQPLAEVQSRWMNCWADEDFSPMGDLSLMDGIRPSAKWVDQLREHLLELLREDENQ